MIIAQKDRKGYKNVTYHSNHQAIRKCYLKTTLRNFNTECQQKI